jgi:hypothetical protein
VHPTQLMLCRINQGEFRHRLHFAFSPTVPYLTHSVDALLVCSSTKL